MIDNNRKKLLINKLNKLSSYHEIQNIMGRLVVALNFQRKEEVLSYFALDQDDVSVEYADEGLFVGKQAIEALLNDFLIKDNKEGYMLDMQLTTPMIEVANDVKTAKGLWWTPGIGSVPQENNDPQALWYWGMLGVDFIYEDNTWKVWHLHYFRLIKCDYHKGWVEDISMVNRKNNLHPLAKETTYHNPYTPESIRVGLPACPRAYDTYENSDKNWMLNKDKR